MGNKTHSRSSKNIDINFDKVINNNDQNIENKNDQNILNDKMNTTVDNSSKTKNLKLFQNNIEFESKEDKIKRLTRFYRFKLSKQIPITKSELNPNSLISAARELSNNLISIKVNGEFNNTLFNCTVVPELNLYQSIQAMPTNNNNYYIENCYKSNIEALKVLSYDDNTLFKSKNISKLFELNDKNFTNEEKEELESLKSKCIMIEAKELREFKEEFERKRGKESTGNNSANSIMKNMKNKLDDSASSTSKHTSRSKTPDNAEDQKNKSIEKKLNKSYDNINSKYKSFDRRKDYDLKHNTNNSNRLFAEEKSKDMNSTQKTLNKGIHDDSKSNYSTTSKNFMRRKDKHKIKTIVHKVDYGKMIEYYQNKSKQEVKK